MTADIEFAKIIAAQPGYYVLEYFEGVDGSPATFYEEPILAWALDCEFYTASPITQGGVKLDSPVLRPDGTVAVAGAEFWINVADWRADKQEELEVQRKQERWDAFRKQRGLVEEIEPAVMPVPASSSPMAVIHAALNAARPAKVVQ